MHQFRLQSFEAACTIFREQQLPLLQKKYSPISYTIGGEFLQFLSSMIVSSDPSTWGAAINKEDIIRARAQEGLSDAIWNTQATFWAQIETPCTYFTFGGLFYEWLEGKKTDRILSVGCGPGLYEIFLSHKLNQKQLTIITGTDFSNGMVTEGTINKKRYRELYGSDSRTLFKQNDANIFQGIPDNSKDVVLSNNVLNWLPRWKKSLYEIHRVLKPGGWAIVSTRTEEPQITLTGQETIKPVPRIDPKELNAYMNRIFGTVEKLHIYEVPFGFGQGGNRDARFTYLLHKR